MINTEEQTFLNGLDKKLWTSADKLRSTLDASQYKHTVLGMIFLKYVSDSFDIRRRELTEQFKTPDHEYYLDPEDFGGPDSEEYQVEINEELEQRDYYTEANVFWVPKVARWEFLQNQNKVVSPVKLKSAKATPKRKSAPSASLSTTPWKPSNMTTLNSKVCSTNATLSYKLTRPNSVN